MNIININLKIKNYESKPYKLTIIKLILKVMCTTVYIIIYNNYTFKK